ncbi:hypothetical protein BD410DRAFT_846480 [Rickenella mellea]|uniref:Uncharacterized protein n=1 Tax=Rickenella mellea TaxID=50990 RepID=A0A4Y7PFX9_9AGAM|nr:hypothetical protein BD410DRAFT_846480 [Rickenella mellea]
MPIKLPDAPRSRRGRPVRAPPSRGIPSADNAPPRNLNTERTAVTVDREARASISNVPHPTRGTTRGRPRGVGGRGGTTRVRINPVHCDEELQVEPNNSSTDPNEDISLSGIQSLNLDASLAQTNADRGEDDLELLGSRRSAGHTEHTSSLGPHQNSIRPTTSPATSLPAIISGLRFRRAPPAARSTQEPHHLIEGTQADAMQNTSIGYRRHIADPTNHQYQLPSVPNQLTTTRTHTSTPAASAYASTADVDQFLANLASRSVPQTVIYFGFSGPLSSDTFILPHVNEVPVYVSDIMRHIALSNTSAARAIVSCGDVGDIYTVSTSTIPEAVQSSTFSSPLNGYMEHGLFYGDNYFDDCFTTTPARPAHNSVLRSRLMESLGLGSDAKVFVLYAILKYIQPPQPTPLLIQPPTIPSPDVALNNTSNHANNLPPSTNFQAALTSLIEHVGLQHPDLAVPLSQLRNNAFQGAYRKYMQHFYIQQTCRALQMNPSDWITNSYHGSLQIPVSMLHIVALAGAVDGTYCNKRSTFEAVSNALNQLAYHERAGTISSDNLALLRQLQTFVQVRTPEEFNSQVFTVPELRWTLTQLVAKVINWRITR